MNFTSLKHMPSISFINTENKNKNPSMMMNNDSVNPWQNKVFTPVKRPVILKKQSNNYSAK